MNSDGKSLDSDLEIGNFGLGRLEIRKTFRGNELVIGRDAYGMATICWDGSDDMMFSTYSVRQNGGAMANVFLIMQAKIVPSDFFYGRYKPMLEEMESQRGVPI